MNKNLHCIPGGKGRGNGSLKRLALALLMIVGAAMPAAKAQTTYVFYNGTYGYLYNDNGTTKSGDLRFDKSSVWTASGTIGGTSRTIQSYTSQQYLGASAGLSNTSSNWQGSNNYLCYRSGRTNYYLKATNATTFTTNSNQNDGNRYYYYTVTIYEGVETFTDFTINSGADVITQTGNYNYGHSNSQYTPAYTDYYFSYNHHYVGSSNNTLDNVNATNVTTGYTWTLSDNAAGYATLTDNTINVTAIPTSDLTLTLTCSVTYQGITKTATKEITLQGAYPPAPTISASGNTVTLSTNAAGTTTIRYTLTGTDPTATTGTVYGGSAFDLSNHSTSPVTIKAVTVRGGVASSVAEHVLTLTLPTPVITTDPSNGEATITCSNTSATVYYTTDGSEPSSTNGTAYTTTITGLAMMNTVKAIAVKTGWNDSPVASALLTIPSSVSGGVVTLNDLEDHNWTYYSGVDASVDDGNYNTNYLGKLYSPNPRNVKITYKANGGAVSIDESDTEFVYYKTIEQIDGAYKYTVISNPFSKRPNGKGFGGWKIKEGADYISGYADEATLPLDAEITLTGLDADYTANCISAEIELEATWVNYNNLTYANNNTITYNVSGGTYETNFLVLNRNVTGTITTTSPVTIMMVEPDGSTDYRGTYTFTGNITPNNNGVTKIEWAKWNPSDNIDATGRNVTIGRGMTVGGTARSIYGTNTTSNGMNQILKIESGYFKEYIGYNAKPSSITKHHVVFGNDYDRASGTNTNLTITNEMRLIQSQLNTVNTTAGVELGIITAKSGQFTTALTHTSAQASANCFYLWDAGSSNTSKGYRKLVIEGGIFWNIGGGMDKSNSTDRVTLELRVKGGEIKGSIYGGGATYDAAGHRLFVFTGGNIGGWIAPGANGIVSNGTSLLYGETFIYIGGTTNVDSKFADYIKIDNSTGGNVFGAGCGYSSTNTRGEVEQGTNVVLADEAFVEHGVYGGGAYGLCKNTETANIYITGGHVGATYDSGFGVSGGVFGGARQNNGGSVNIYMTGGQIDGDIFGGSNHIGVLSGTSTVKMYGGTVNGSLYGGGNGTGDATNISGAVQVSVYGGTIGGAVYGCNNVSGAPQNTVTVDVYGTDPAPSANTYAISQVFGGGNMADYSGTPVVTVHCTDEATPISIGELYGGGNQATVSGTNVTVAAGNIIGAVYGGGRAAAVEGNTLVTVKGGTIRQVYGGNNLSGTIDGTISVNVNKDSDCPMKVGQVYGGGNMAASQVGTITIGCTGTLVSPLADGERYGYDQEGVGAVYGGANNANITGNITLSIVSGIVDSVFGGNNNGGTINGDITVTIAKDGGASCASDWYVGYVYGGGNKAAYTQKTADHPVVNHTAGHVTHNIFGGGKGLTATVTGNPQVTLSGSATVGGNVFGGGDAAEVRGSTKVTLKN